MSPRVVNKEDKKVQIIDAALLVFSKVGFSKTKIQDIADQAGIGKGTVYEYFKSKNELFEMTIIRFIELLNTEIGKKIFLINDPSEKLRVFIKESFSAYKTHSHYMDIMFDYWSEGIRDNNKKSLMVKMYDEYTDYICSILDEGISKKAFDIENPSAFAAILLCAMDGLLLRWLMDKDNFPIDDVVNTLIDSTFNGIKK